jgi:SAM-dependent methyltransferase
MRREEITNKRGGFVLYGTHAHSLFFTPPSFKLSIVFEQMSIFILVSRYGRSARQVGPTGTVYGIDAPPEMLARAEKKARKADVEVVLKHAMAQALPFPDAQFDAVLITVMLHHLPHKARQQCAAEMRRVLKPGGRVLAVDFGSSAREQKGVLAHFHRHGYVKLPDIIGLLSEAGLNSVESGAVGIPDLQFVLAKLPCCA